MSDFPRTAVDGVVRHPLTGAVEFQTTDPGLAEKIAATLDEHDPVDVAWIYETFSAMHPRDRIGAEWVMPTSVRLRIRRAAYGGIPLMVPPMTFEGPEYLLGLPIITDEEALGVTLRVREPVGYVIADEVTR